MDDLTTPPDLPAVLADIVPPLGLAYARWSGDACPMRGGAERIEQLLIEERSRSQEQAPGGGDG